MTEHASDSKTQNALMLWPPGSTYVRTVRLLVCRERHRKPQSSLSCNFQTRFIKFEFSSLKNKRLTKSNILIPEWRIQNPDQLAGISNLAHTTSQCFLTILNVWQYDECLPLIRHFKPRIMIQFQTQNYRIQRTNNIQAICKWQVRTTSIQSNWE